MNQVIPIPPIVSTVTTVHAVDRWKEAVVNELMTAHIYGSSHQHDPKKAIQDVISWHVQVALDPQVSSDAQKLIDRGAAEERARLQG